MQSRVFYFFMPLGVVLYFTKKNFFHKNLIYFLKKLEDIFKYEQILQIILTFRQKGAIIHLFNFKIAETYALKAKFQLWGYAVEHIRMAI